MIYHNHRGRRFAFSTSIFEQAFDFAMYNSKREKRNGFYFLVKKYMSFFGLPKRDCEALADLVLDEIRRC